MTREEAINKWIIPTISSRFNGNRCEEILEALEQESVLDKIRAEIEQIELFASYTRGDIKQKVLDIIDKYRAESEVPYNDKASAIHSEVYKEE